VFDGRNLGQIPSGLSQLQSLELFHASNAGISGSIPGELGSLRSFGSLKKKADKLQSYDEEPIGLSRGCSSATATASAAFDFIFTCGFPVTIAIAINPPAVQPSPSNGGNNAVVPPSVSSPSNGGSTNNNNSPSTGGGTTSNTGGSSSGNSNNSGGSSASPGGSSPSVGSGSSGGNASNNTGATATVSAVQPAPTSSSGDEGGFRMGNLSKDQSIGLLVGIIGFVGAIMAAIIPICAKRAH
ncbi:hypothetical protein HDU96_006886, partial [Phlyctochytrium bullatum]